MRRPALLGLSLLLAGCNYVGSPFEGFGGFMGDTVSANANRPAGAGANMRRVTGEDVPAEPLLPEAGNVWPGPLPPAKTMSDLQREDRGNPPQEPRPIPRGSSTPGAPVTVTPPPPVSSVSPPTPRFASPPAGSRVLQTPSGPATTSTGQNGVETFMTPSGRTGVVVPNGNGSSSMIGSDGSIVTVPGGR
ncbi:MAG TPA: hypothetical protein VGC80_18310 [Acetobacteraceae bacterium]|jgi:hypothetical protein